MKRPANYVPKFSLSIETLKKIMDKKDFKNLLKKYVQYKIENWNNEYEKNNKKIKK
jgi:hypothetical protein